jgi:hypothetical protein
MTGILALAVHDLQGRKIPNASQARSAATPQAGVFCKQQFVINSGTLGTCLNSKFRVPE